MQETTFTPVLVIFLCMALRLYCQKEASYTQKRSRGTFETEKLFFCTRADPQYLYAVLHRIFHQPAVSADSLLRADPGNRARYRKTAFAPFHPRRLSAQDLSLCALLCKLFFYGQRHCTSNFRQRSSVPVYTLYSAAEPGRLYPGRNDSASPR